MYPAVSSPEERYFPEGSYGNKPSEAESPWSKISARLPRYESGPRHPDVGVVAQQIGWRPDSCSLQEYLAKERIHRYGHAGRHVSPSLIMSIKPPRESVLTPFKTTRRRRAEQEEAKERAVTANTEQRSTASTVPRADTAGGDSAQGGGGKRDQLRLALSDGGGEQLGGDGAEELNLTSRSSRASPNKTVPRLSPAHIPELDWDQNASQGGGALKSSGKVSIVGMRREEDSMKEAGGGQGGDGVGGEEARIDLMAGERRPSHDLPANSHGGERSRLGGVSVSLRSRKGRRVVLQLSAREGGGQAAYFDQREAASQLVKDKASNSPRGSAGPLHLRAPAAPLRWHQSSPAASKTAPVPAPPVSGRLFAQDREEYKGGTYEGFRSGNGRAMTAADEEDAGDDAGLPEEANRGSTLHNLTVSKALATPGVAHELVQVGRVLTVQSRKTSEHASLEGIRRMLGSASTSPREVKVPSLWGGGPLTPSMQGATALEGGSDRLPRSPRERAAGVGGTTSSPSKLSLREEAASSCEPSRNPGTRPTPTEIPHTRKTLARNLSNARRKASPNKIELFTTSYKSGHWLPAGSQWLGETCPSPSPHRSASLINRRRSNTMTSQGLFNSTSTSFPRTPTSSAHPPTAVALSWTPVSFLEAPPASPSLTSPRDNTACASPKSALLRMMAGAFPHPFKVPPFTPNASAKRPQAFPLASSESSPRMHRASSLPADAAASHSGGAKGGDSEEEVMARVWKAEVLRRLRKDKAEIDAVAARIAAGEADARDVSRLRAKVSLLKKRLLWSEEHDELE